MEDFVEGSEGSEVTSILRRERSFFMGIQRLTDGLEHLNHFLEGADMKSVEEVLRESVKSWMEETNEAGGVERYLEEDYLLRFSQVLQQGRVINFLGRAGRRFSRLSMSRNLASDFQSNKALPIGVDENGPTRDEDASARTSVIQQNNGKLFYSFAEEYVDSAAKDVMARLIEGPPEPLVVSLVGPNGIGKTNLARKIYDSQMFRYHFDCCGWIDVSKTYKLKEVLKDLIEQIDREGRHGEVLQGMRAMELFNTLRQSLEQKRYMFVFDDVCHEEFWHVMKQGLPDNKKGSRIIITTTSDAIAEVGSPGQVRKLGPLSKAMSWELFCRLAFQGDPEWQCPKELEIFSSEVIRMCKGFPIPIVAIAGLLSTKEREVSECQKILQNFIFDFKSNPNPPVVLDILALSFRDLPNHLRSCFLYFGIFPVDALISKDKIFKLWIAEGFVEEKKGKILEEVAEEYLNELIKRNLVQTCQGFCQVHSLIHNMARVKAREHNFFLIWDDKNSNYRRNVPRLSVYNVYISLEMIKDSSIRSVFLFIVSTLPNSFLVSLIKKCLFLTLLDLEYVPVDFLPQALGDLSNLKYLCLKNTKVSSLPKSIKKLHNLQTLDVRNTQLIELPIEITSLKNLQHLLASVYDNRISGDSTRGVRTRGGIGSLENLQTLMTVEGHHNGIGLLKELVKLQKLRKLGISGLGREFGNSLCAVIHEFIHLECLTLRAMNKNEILDVQTISFPPLVLRYLVLKGLLQRFPYWITCLHNLTTLCLSLSKLTIDPLMHLSLLPNLVSLWLYRAYEGEQLCFEEGGFQRLKLLVLKDLKSLNAVEIEEGSLPRLEEIRIGPSPLLNEVPSGIQHLRNLKVLANYDMPNEFVLSMQPDGGSDYGKVKHIPSVLFLYRVHGRSYKVYKLGDSDLVDHLQGLVAIREAVPQHQHEFELSFCESDDDEEEEDEVGTLSRSSTQSLLPRKSTKQWSFSSGFYTDDLEE